MTPSGPASLDVGTGGRLRARQTELAEALVERQLADEPDLIHRYGPVGRVKCLEDANYHLAHLSSAIDAGDPALFASYVAWARLMLERRGIPAPDLVRYLARLRAALAARLDDHTAALAIRYLDSGLLELASQPHELPTFLRPDAPLGGLARAYLDALLAGERQRASTLILDAVATAVPVRDIYLHVFQPAQYEIGRLWQLNEIGVAQEHYCTAAAQLIMSQLYPHIFATRKGPGTLVATCVAGDLHEIGVRMVADFFELDGWNTFYLGSNTPASAVIETLRLRRARVLGVSVTLTSHLRAAVELIQKVRASPEFRDVAILVGGRPFLASPGLWKTVGADGWAADAQLAIAQANRWLEEPPRASA